MSDAVDSSAGGAARPGRTVADVRLKEVRTGSPVALSGLLAESPARQGIVAVFWSAACSHCRRYDSYLNGFAGAHPELALVAIGARQSEGPAELEQAIEDRDLAFPILHDPDLEVADAWQVAQTPRAFLLDRRLRLLYRGAIDNFKYREDPEHAAYLEEAIADLLAGRPIGRPETPGFGCPTRSVYFDLPKPLGQ